MGWKTWEWKAAIRSPVHPYLLGFIYYIAKFLNIQNDLLIVFINYIKIKFFFF